MVGNLRTIPRRVIGTKEPKLSLVDTSDEPPADTTTERSWRRRFILPAFLDTAIDRTRKSDRYLVATISILALIAGISHLGAHPLWYDEGYSISFAAASPHAFANALHHVDGPIALYYAILRGWFFIVPISVETARIPSLAFAIGSLPAVYLLGRELFSRKAGLFAALLLSFNSSWWLRAEDARVYSLAIFASICGFLFFARMLFRTASSRRLQDAVWAGAFTSLTVLLQAIVGGTTIVAQLVAALFMKGRPPRAIFLAFGTCATLVGFGLIAFVLGHLGRTDSQWLSVPKSATQLLADLNEALGTRFMFAPAAIAIAVALFANRRDRRVLVLLLWTVVPILCIAASLFIRPLFIDRYLLASLAPFIVLIAVGLASIRKVGVAACLALLLFGSEGLETVHEDHRPHEEWLSTIRVLQKDTRPGDVVDVVPRGAAVPLTTQLALSRMTLPPYLAFYPADGQHQWSRGSYDSPPIPAALTKGTTWILYWGFTKYEVPGPDVPMLLKTHHVCGRFDSGARPLLIKFCKN